MDCCAQTCVQVNSRLKGRLHDFVNRTSDSACAAAAAAAAGVVVAFFTFSVSSSFNRPLVAHLDKQFYSKSLVTFSALLVAVATTTTTTTTTLPTTSLAHTLLLLPLLVAASQLWRRLRWARLFPLSISKIKPDSVSASVWTIHSISSSWRAEKSKPATETETLDTGPLT